MSWPASAAASITASRQRASVLKIRPSMSNTTARALRGSFMVGCRSRGGLGRGLVIGGQVDRRALDRGLPRRRRDLGTEQVGDVEHVAGALAEGRDMGGGDVEVELRNRGGQLIQEAGPVAGCHRDHG